MCHYDLTLNDFIDAPNAVAVRNDSVTLQFLLHSRIDFAHAQDDGEVIHSLVLHGAQRVAAVSSINAFEYLPLSIPLMSLSLRDFSSF